MEGTFIAVGNSHHKFDRLFSELPTFLKLLPQPVVIQCGHNSFLSHEATVIPFVEMDEFSSFLENSSLVIIHGGAGSIIQALRANKIPLVVPRRKFFDEHVDDHQYELSRELSRLNRIIMIESPSEITQNVSKVLEFQKTYPRSFSNPNGLMRSISNSLDSLANLSNIDQSNN